MPAGPFTSPDRYLYEFAGDDAVIVPMDRAAYRRSIFLDARISPASEAAEMVPVSALAAPAGPGPAWIFHVAHCGSTLLARALDTPGWRNRAARAAGAAPARHGGSERRTRGTTGRRGWR